MEKENDELTELDKEFILDLINDNVLMQKYNANYTRHLVRIADKLRAQGIEAVTAGELIEQERESVSAELNESHKRSR